MPTLGVEYSSKALVSFGYLIDRFEDGLSIYDIDFEYIEGVNKHPVDVAQHHRSPHPNVYKGRMDYWAQYYENYPLGKSDTLTQGEYTDWFRAPCARWID